MPSISDSSVRGPSRPHLEPRVPGSSNGGIGGRVPAINSSPRLDPDGRSCVEEVPEVAETGRAASDLSGSPGAPGVPTCLLPKHAMAPSFRIFRALSETQRQRARGLTHQAYRDKGYLKPGESHDLLYPQDACGDSFVFLVESRAEETVATASVFFDASLGLPCDDPFKIQSNGLRRQGRRLAEIVRLAVRPNAPEPRLLLCRLFNLLYLGAQRVKGYTDLVIEVHPRHALYYCKSFGFQRVAGPLPCPRVGGSPGVLLRLDLDWTQTQIDRQRLVGPPANREPRRCLYPWALGADDESGVCERMESIRGTGWLWSESVSGGAVRRDRAGQWPASAVGQVQERERLS